MAQRAGHRRRGVLLAGAVVVVLVLSSGGSDPNRPLSDSEVASTARAFARAYGNENMAALRALLTADVERVSPADTQRGRENVLSQYREQFQANRTRAYRLRDLNVSGGPAGRAAAAFTVVRDGSPADHRPRRDRHRPRRRPAPDPADRHRAAQLTVSRASRRAP